MKLILFIVVAANFLAIVNCSCDCVPSQNVSSTLAAISFGSPTDSGIGGTPCAPINCSTTIIFVGNLGNGLPAGAQINILPCHNLSNDNTITLLANNQTFNSCQSDIYKFSVTNTNVFTFVFQLTTPISFTVVLQPIIQNVSTSTTSATMSYSSPTVASTPTPSITYPQTTIAPVTKTTSYGYQSIFADIVIILDASDTVTQFQQNDIKQFLFNALSQFTINESFINVAIIVALGDQFPIILVKNTFKSIDTSNGLRNALENAFQNSDFESGTGQSSLAQAVKQLYNDDFLKRGYRNTTQNHLAIYVTTLNSPNQAAIDATQTVMAMNLFKFMAVGYQGGANDGPLTSFVGGNQDCVIISSDQTMISDKITEKIWNANFNGGNYR